MARSGDDDQAPSQDASSGSSKGKGKATATGGQAGAPSSLARLAQGVGNGMSSAAADIAGLMASQGKGGPAMGGSGGGLSSGMSYEGGLQAIESQRSGEHGRGASASRTFRTATDGSRNPRNVADAAYASFEAGETPAGTSHATLPTWSSGSRDVAIVGAYGNAEHLDQPLHAHAQDMREMAWTAAPHLRDQLARTAAIETAGPSTPAQDAAMDEAWQAALRQQPAWEETYVPELYDVEYHEAWARTIPTPVFPVANSADVNETLANGLSNIQVGEGAETGFMDALLADEELTSVREAVPRRDSHPRAGGGAAGISIVPRWHPPSPSLAPAMTTEQRDLHLELAALQDPLLSSRVPATLAPLAVDAVRADSSIAPPADDAELREGVYAPTPEEALSAILDSPEEISRIRKHRREEAIKAERQRATQEGRMVDENLIRKLREWMPRGTMLEDVYGLPPLLQQTLLDAYEEESPSSTDSHEDQDRRARAVRRLEALRGHLLPSSGPSLTLQGSTASPPPLPPPRTVGVHEMEAFLRNNR